MLIPEALESSGRDVAQVERCRSQTPNRPGAAQECAEHLDEIAGLFVHVVRKTGHEQRIEERIGRRDAQGDAVDEGADSALRGDRKSTRLNSSHLGISYAVFCLK